MYWGAFSAAGPGPITPIRGRMNQYDYQEIIKENLPIAIEELDLDQESFWLQQDNG